jgi:hypothetical protein
MDTKTPPILLFSIIHQAPNFHLLYCSAPLQWVLSLHFCLEIDAKSLFTMLGSKTVETKTPCFCLVPNQWTPRLLTLCSAPLVGTKSPTTWPWVGKGALFPELTPPLLLTVALSRIMTELRTHCCSCRFTHCELFCADLSITYITHIHLCFARGICFDIIYLPGSASSLYGLTPPHHCKE